MDASVAVVIPSYNGARFIREAIASAQQQSRQPAEIIVVDDCSRDDTVALAEAMAAKSSVPLRVVRLPQNSGGPSRPINAGIDAAQADLILVLDQDDLLDRDRLAIDAPILERHQAISIVISWCGDVDRNGTHQGDEVKAALSGAGRSRDGFVEIAGDVAAALLVRHKNFVLGYPGMIFRKSAWVAKGGVDESLRIAGDMELIGWLFIHGQAALVPRVGYYRREHDSNATKRSWDTNYYEILKVCCDLVGAHPVLRDDASLRQALEAELRLMMYSLRQRGHYQAAAEACRLLPRLGVGPINFALSQCKLRVHALVRPFLGLKRQHPSQPIA